MAFRFAINGSDQLEVPLISVVIPVYNIAPYLDECVNSVLSQTYPRIEIILVDDGSTDGSEELCDRYSNTTNNIRVIHKPNGGLSDARNMGLRNCGGEYVAFIDGDDIISPVFIEVLYELIRQSGSLVSSVPRGVVFEDGNDAKLIHRLDEVVDVCDIEVLNASDFIGRLLYQSIETGVPWRLYKRELLGDAPFPVGIYYEDLASVYRIVREAESVTLISEERLYAYRMRSGSIQHNSNYEQKIESAVIVASQLYSDILEWYPNLATAASSRCFSVCRNVFAQIPLGQRKGKDSIWTVLKRHRRTVLFDSSARAKERFAAMVACCGKPAFSLFCMICRNVGLMI